MFSNRPYCTVGDVESEGDMTKFTVTFGRVRTCSFGDKIQSSPIKAGGGSWIVVYFPKVGAVPLLRLLAAQWDLGLGHVRIVGLWDVWFWKGSYRPTSCIFWSKYYGAVIHANGPSL